MSRGRRNTGRRMHLEDFAGVAAPPLEGSSLDVFRWIDRLVLIEHERAAQRQAHRRLSHEILATARAATLLRSACLTAEASRLVDFAAVHPDEPPPLDDELRAAAWMVKRLAAYLHGLIQGHTALNEGHGAALRRTVRTWVTVIPPELSLEVARRLQKERRERFEGAPVVPAPRRQPLRLVE